MCLEGRIQPFLYMKCINHLKNLQNIFVKKKKKKKELSRQTSSLTSTLCSLELRGSLKSLYFNSSCHCRTATVLPHEGKRKKGRLEELFVYIFISQTIKFHYEFIFTVPQVERQVLDFFVVCSQTHSLRDNQLQNSATGFSPLVYQNFKHPPGNLCQEENHFSIQ